MKTSQSNKPKVGDIWSNEYLVINEGMVRYYYLLVENIEPKFNMFNTLRLDTSSYCIHQISLPQGGDWKFEA
jgi:hypothetical protein